MSQTREYYTRNTDGKLVGWAIKSEEGWKIYSNGEYCETVKGSAKEIKETLLCYGGSKVVAA